MVIKNESDYYNVRTLYIPDNFTDFIKINSSKSNQKFISEMNEFIKETIKSYPFEEKIYSLEECSNDFNIKSIF